MAEYKINNLWTDLSLTDTKEKTAKILAKAAKPLKTVKVLSDEALLKSKKVSLQDKLVIIERNVNRVLGNKKDSTLVIRTADDLRSYINLAIINGVLSVDTETNNSKDPLTCKLMGPCLYTPGQKQVYIPVNHKDLTTHELLPDQLTEDIIHQELERAKLAGTKIIMHHAKFDYKVIKCTTGLALVPYWDTMIAAKILNENEPARLKWQYKTKIDPDMDVYSIETFFAGIEYAYVPPELFALYAATDAYDTYKVYEYQLKEFQKPGHEKLFDLFLNIEMPVVEVTSEMELYGVNIDKELSTRLLTKWTEKSRKNTEALDQEMLKYAPVIAKWRTSAQATYRTPKLDKETGVQRVDKKGNKLFNKSKAEQLSDPVELTSPTQLAILLYDILKIPPVDPTNPRGTGDEILKEIQLPIAKLLSEKRAIDKLINSFLVPLPELVRDDGRIHAEFNQLGTDEKNVVTGRFSSKAPNLQQIPSRGVGASIRMLFTASCDEHALESINNIYEVPITDEVLLPSGEYVWAKDVEVGMTISDNEVVNNVSISDKFVYISV